MGWDSIEIGYLTDDDDDDDNDVSIRDRGDSLDCTYHIMTVQTS